MRLSCLFLVATLAVAQDFEPKFDLIITEINRGRFDKALEQTFPIQAEIRKRATAPPQFDAGLRQRIGEMNNTTAVLSTIALLRSQLIQSKWDDAQISSFFVGMGLSRLWSELPAHRRLGYAQEDLKDVAPARREMQLRRVGFAALEARDMEALEAAVGELEAILNRKDSSVVEPGALQHVVLTLRGLQELNRGDVPAAEKALLASMRIPFELGMRNLGPNFRLAIELLNLGRTQAVDQFLALVQASPWREASKVADWRKQLAAGQTPDLPRFSSL